MTQRQILLHYGCLLRRERQQRVARTRDVNMGFTGGKPCAAYLAAFERD
jgi:hypothetical protein